MSALPNFATRLAAAWKATNSLVCVGLDPEPKKFPERRLYPGGPPDPPYDMTGYELSLQMGV